FFLSALSFAMCFLASCEPLASFAGRRFVVASASTCLAMVHSSPATTEMPHLAKCLRIASRSITSPIQDVRRGRLPRLFEHFRDGQRPVRLGHLGLGLGFTRLHGALREHRLPRLLCPPGAILGDQRTVVEAVRELLRGVPAYLKEVPLESD